MKFVKYDSGLDVIRFCALCQRAFKGDQISDGTLLFCSENCRDLFLEIENETNTTQINKGNCCETKLCPMCRLYVKDAEFVEGVCENCACILFNLF